jgi:hypothetical protein
MRKIAILATVIALASAPTAALAIIGSVTLPPGPGSVVTNCETSGDDIILLGQTQTFDLTDVTIANNTGSNVSVFITNSFGAGVLYVATADSNVTQKFETPIRFKGPSNSPLLNCGGSTSGNVTISIQGLMH